MSRLMKSARGILALACPYLAAAIGAGHDAAWQAALSLVGVNPAIAVLVGFGFAFFWTWVSSHC